VQQSDERVERLKNLADRPLTESEIVDATVAFANGARLEIEGLEPRGTLGKTGDEELARNMRAYARLHEGGIVLSGRRVAVQPPMARTLEEWRHLQRAGTRAGLERILSNPTAAAKWFVEGTDLAEEISVSAVFRVPPSQLLTHRYSFATYCDLVLLGQILLADASRAFQAKLCQCLYPHCGMFFFEMKASVSRRGGGGMRRRKYCCDDHMNRARDERRTERAQAKRRAVRRPK
jgi:hypothetical protein